MCGGGPGCFAAHVPIGRAGAGLATALGLFVLATLIASTGYLAASFGWRWWVARKRQTRLGLALARREAAAAAAG